MIQAENLKKRLEQKIAEQKILSEEHSVAKNMKHNFETFMHSVIDLPENDTRTRPHHIQYILQNFILKIRAWKDEIQYSTIFGLILISTGNSRPVSSWM